MIKITSAKLPKSTALHENEWLDLRIIKDPDNGVDGYVYSHESRCDGKIISLLPYRKISKGHEFLLRRELTPCWGMQYNISSITGGFENNLGIKDTAVHELCEEGGYEIQASELIDLGTCFGTKSSDTVYHLFSADLSGKDRGKAEGDGSRLEDEAECFWSDSVKHAVDPLVAIMFVRLNLGEK